MPDKAVLDEVSKLLRAKAQELQIELDTLAAPPDATGDISFGKRVGDGTSIAVERYTNVAVHDRLRSTLAAVDRAEAKLAAGNYGECDVCGAAIPTDRLEALPWATTCVKCPFSPNRLTWRGRNWP